METEGQWQNNGAGEGVRGTPYPFTIILSLALSLPSATSTKWSPMNAVHHINWDRQLHRLQESGMMPMWPPMFCFSACWWILELLVSQTARWATGTVPEDSRLLWCFHLLSCHWNLSDRNDRKSSVQYQRVSEFLWHQEYIFYFTSVCWWLKLPPLSLHAIHTPNYFLFRILACTVVRLGIEKSPYNLANFCWK